MQDVPAARHLHALEATGPFEGVAEHSWQEVRIAIRQVGRRRPAAARPDCGVAS